MQNEARPTEEQVAAEAFTQLVALSGSSNQHVAIGSARLLPIFCITENQACC